MIELVSKQEVLKAIAKDLCFTSTLDSDYASTNWEDYLEIAEMIIEDVPIVEKRGS